MKIFSELCSVVRLHSGSTLSCGFKFLEKHGSPFARNRRPGASTNKWWNVQSKHKGNQEFLNVERGVNPSDEKEKRIYSEITNNRGSSHINRKMFLLNYIFSLTRDTFRYL